MKVETINAGDIAVDPNQKIRTYTGEISHLLPNQFEVVDLDFVGIQGQQYGLPLNDDYNYNICGLYLHAAANPDHEFLLPFSLVENNKLGYNANAMTMYFCIDSIPQNIVFEKELALLIKQLMAD